MILQLHLSSVFGAISFLSMFINKDFFRLSKYEYIFVVLAQPPCYVDHLTDVSFVDGLLKHRCQALLLSR